MYVKKMKTIRINGITTNSASLIILILFHIFYKPPVKPTQDKKYEQHYKPGYVQPVTADDDHLSSLTVTSKLKRPT